jgi:16S rRNA (cytidine1402-2'-O)-methyltransferase
MNPILKKSKMPSNPPVHKSDDSSVKGCLYVVATPLGNLADITLRALEVLKSVDIVAAEDTRKTRRLLNHHNIKQKLISYHEHNEQRRASDLLSRLEHGKDIALVSDAGTPGISDPGYRLVTAAAGAGIQVVPIPGVSAVTTALSAAGMPTDAFVFAGFAPKKKGRRLKLLNQLAASPFTNVFYESPQRIIGLLKDIRDTMGDRPCVVAREMTKLHEEFLRGRISQILEVLADRNQVKGECTVLIAGHRGENEIDWDEVLNAIAAGLEQADLRPTALARTISDQFGVPKNKIYDEILRQKSERGD